jgi:hypothetical protein
MHPLLSRHHLGVHEHAGAQPIVARRASHASNALNSDGTSSCTWLMWLPIWMQTKCGTSPSCLAAPARGLTDRDLASAQWRGRRSESVSSCRRCKCCHPVCGQVELFSWVLRVIEHHLRSREHLHRDATTSITLDDALLCIGAVSLHLAKELLALEHLYFAGAGCVLQPVSY